MVGVTPMDSVPRLSLRFNQGGVIARNARSRWLAVRFTRDNYATKFRGTDVNSRHFNKHRCHSQNFKFKLDIHNRHHESAHFVNPSKNNS